MFYILLLLILVLILNVVLVFLCSPWFSFGVVKSSDFTGQRHGIIRVKKEIKSRKKECYSKKN